MSEWLERELARQLGAVRAPDGLWERVAGGAGVSGASRLGRRIACPTWARWAVAAVVALTVLWLPGQLRYPAFHPTVLAAYEARSTSDWPLHCALPAGTTPYQVAAFVTRKTVPSGPLARFSIDCYQCHTAIQN